MWYSDLAQFKEQNGYEVNGIWYPRVTRILDVKAKPALEHFFKEMESYSSAEDVKNKSAAERFCDNNAAGKNNSKSIQIKAYLNRRAYQRGDCKKERAWKKT